MEHYLSHIFIQKNIEDYIETRSEESINLEFKRGDALSDTENHKKELSKDVSAFANSDGGVIIYGISEGEGEEKHKANSTSFIDGNFITKEWIEQVINSRIQRKIIGLLIDPIRFDDDIKKSIYVIKIPKSPNAPHMNSDKKFYKRYNFHSVQMEEYEVRDLYNRQGKTVLKIRYPEIKFDATELLFKNITTQSQSTINFYIENQSQSIEKMYKLEIHIPEGIYRSDNGYLQSIFKYWNRSYSFYQVISIPSSSPLFQNEVILIESLNFNILHNNVNDCYEKPIKLKLYYSNGIDELSWFILNKETFIPILQKSKKIIPNGFKLSLSDWID